MRTKFIHLSDLHFIPEWDESIGLIVDNLLIDIKDRVVGSEPAYLVFSGDHVKAGGNKEHYDAFHKLFDDKLAQVGLTRDMRIVVPGNHDLSQAALRPLLRMQKGLLAEIRDEREFNDEFPQVSDLILKQKFLSYIAFEERFAKHRCCADSLGGSGWSLGNGVGVYCLNTAACSFGGLRDDMGNVIGDYGRLMVDTRHLYRWLNEQKNEIRLLVMHHPVDWLAPWAKTEMERVISASFHCVLSGHVHEAVPEYHSRGTTGTVFASAPPLFTRKNDQLGYTVVVLDHAGKKVEVSYRQWAAATRSFVCGAAFSGTDDGRVIFPTTANNRESSPKRPVSTDTASQIQQEFDDALLFFSTKRALWVERDLSCRAETALKDSAEIVITDSEIGRNLESCVVRAPRQFGLTCFGKRLAVDCYKRSQNGEVLVSIDATVTPHTRDELSGFLDTRCKQLRISLTQIQGFIIDNWEPTKKGRKLVTALQVIRPQAIFVVLHGIDDCTQIADSFGEVDVDPTVAFKRFYLLSLSRQRIRELVTRYLDGSINLSDDLVFRRVITDIDSLNIHRTPVNCLLLLKLAEQAFDENPVNRTEVIGRVLSLLFFQFNKIPTYASRPDLKDCEYALGYLCEWLIKEHKPAFTKIQFYAKVQEYCGKQLLQIDVDVLFAFLVSETIFVKKGDVFEFRFAYWLHYFAAHRMHHDAAFAAFILDDKRYSAFPEILEFYAGIDRRRTDAITVLTRDLRQMSEEFSKRTGIPPDFNPYKDAEWSPDASALEALRKEVEDGVSVSSIPVSVKDAIADASYNSAKPYKQELAAFMEQSTLRQMVSAMRGAARALRNSDHVDPTAKAELLSQVIDCWIRVAQILVTLSPILADEKSVRFEGINWILGKGFEQMDTTEKRWRSIMTLITTNVVGWYQEDLFSSKLGPLFANHIKANPRGWGELLLVLTMVIQRPVGWEVEVEKLIMRESKNSFYLNRVFSALRSEYKFGSIDERSRQQLRRLAATAIAKHDTGLLRPDLKLIERAARQVLDGKQNSQSEFFR